MMSARASPAPASSHGSLPPAQVDMVLFAGDLFHDNKPSRKALQKCMETLRDHVLGPREVTIEVVSDQNANFHDKYRQVNYEDANYNVQLPVFAIHGEHSASQSSILTH